MISLENRHTRRQFCLAVLGALLAPCCLDDDDFQAKSE